MSHISESNQKELNKTKRGKHDNDKGASAKLTPEEFRKQRLEEMKVQMKTKGKKELSLESNLFGDGKLTAELIDSNTSNLNSESSSSWATRSFDNVVTQDEKKRKKNHDSEDPEAQVDVMFESEEREAAWNDDDDEEERQVVASREIRKNTGKDKMSALEYQQHLREQYVQQTHGSTWADLPTKEEETEADQAISNILSNNAPLTYQGGKNRVTGLDVIPRDTLNISKVNLISTHTGRIVSGKFHPNSELFLTATSRGYVAIHQIDSEKSIKIQGLQLAKFNIGSAYFNREGTEIIASGNKKYLYSYDLVHGAVTQISPPQGRQEREYNYSRISPDGELIALIGSDGYIILLSALTKRYVASLRCSSVVNSLTFSPNSKLLYSACTDGNVYVWDLNTRKCMERFRDDGAIQSTCIAASWDNAYVATGSDSGVANIYSANMKDIVDLGDGLGEKKAPVKTIFNLTTRISALSFSRSNELLAVASDAKDSALRMVHLPTMTIFQNWPHQHSQLGTISDIDFSPNTGFISVGNSNGNVTIYRLHHYDSC